VKLALVTGGFRRVGAAIAGRLAEAGWTLALHCRAESVPEAALAATLAAQGSRWQGFTADLADPRAVMTLLPAIDAHFGQMPGLIVNNASVFGQDDWRGATAETLALHFQVNTTAPVLLATELARSLTDGGTACVINILDQRVRQPNADQLSYTLSKQALAAATQTLARVLTPGVRVNAVAPGLTIATPDYDAAQIALIAGQMPLRRLPTPEDVASAVLWLAGAEATTGQTIYVDGGASQKSFARDFGNL
jgi:pteridine reductase